MGKNKLSSIPSFKSSKNKLKVTPAKAAKTLTKIKAPKNDATIATNVPSTDFKCL